MTRLSEAIPVLDIRFAAVYEVLATASLAWYLTHPSESGNEQYVDAAGVAKARETGVLTRCLGPHHPRAEKALRQLGWIASESPDFQQAMKRYAQAAGLEMEMVRRKRESR